MLLSETIRVARKEKGLTQTELANLCGVSTTAVSAWERGVAVPRSETLSLLGQVLQIPKTGYESPPPPNKSGMSWDEIELLSNYWACTPGTKLAILEMARKGASSSEDPTSIEEPS